MAARHTSVIASGEEQFTSGELRQWGGIVAGTIADFAGALEVSSEAVLQAVQDTGVTPMVDTGRRGDKSTEDHGPRPDDPERRSLAFTTDDFQAVVEAIR